MRQLICTCGGTKFTMSNVVRTSNPPQYGHVCTRCGRTIWTMRRESPDVGDEVYLLDDTIVIGHDSKQPREE